MFFSVAAYAGKNYSLPIDLKYDSVFYRSPEQFIHYGFNDSQINELNYILQKNNWIKYDDPAPINFESLECYGLVYDYVIQAYFIRSDSKMLIRINDPFYGEITENYSVPAEVYSEIEKLAAKY